MLSTYLYKLTNKLGMPSYQLMAAVVVAIIAITSPLVLLQRLLLRQAQRYVSVSGKGRSPAAALAWLALVRLRRRSSSGFSSPSSCRCPASRCARSW